MKKNKNRKKFFPFFCSVSLGLILTFSCNRGGSSSSGDAGILLPLLGGGETSTNRTSTTGGIGSTGTGSSGSTAFNYYESNSDTVKISGESLSVTINPGVGTSTATKQIVLSTDSILDASDTNVGTYTFGSSGSYTVNIPASLVAAGTLVPVRYYYGLIPRESGSPSPKYVTILPNDSAYTSTSWGTVSGSQTLDDTTTLRFYGLFVSSGASKFTVSSSQVASGLDVALLAFRADDGTPIGSETNVNSANNFESNSYTSSGGFLGTSIYVRIRRVGSTQGTFSFHGVQNFLIFPPSGVSCSGGVSIFANRCLTYPSDFLNRPTNNSGCVALQGTGSVYSASSCTSVNRVGQCFANPISNNGRAIMSFYSPETTSNVTSVCGTDVSF